jgi:hypothetical protein
MAMTVYFHKWTLLIRMTKQVDIIGQAAERVVGGAAIRTSASVNSFA